MRGAEMGADARSQIASADEVDELDVAAAAMARLIEDHFDDMGWSEDERSRRVASSHKRISAAVERAKSAESLSIAATVE